MKLTVHVNDPSDYEGRILIEYGTSVPAWDERGLADLEGPFETIAAAEKAIRDNADLLDYYGYTIAPLSTRFARARA